VSEPTWGLVLNRLKETILDELMEFKGLEISRIPVLTREKYEIWKLRITAFYEFFDIELVEII